LQRIVRKALRKDREERYQSVKDMLVDLRALKQELEFEDKLDRSLPPDGRSGTIYRTTSGQSLRVAFETNRELAAQTQETHQPPRSTSSAELIIQEIKRHKGGAILAASVIGLIVLTLTGFIIYRMARSHGESAATAAPFQSTRISRLTSTGNSVDVAMSPDGKYIAHVVNDGSQLSLWVRQVATTINKQLVPPVASEYHGVTFSPDGNYIYYVKGERNKPLSELFQVSVLGGDSRKLVSDIDTAVTFSPDGKRLAFMRNKPTVKEIDLLIANADGSDERVLLTHKTSQFHSPSWSPDGKMIACVSGDKSNAQSTIVSVNVADGSEQPLTAQRWRFVERLAWLPGGVGLALLAPSDETSETSQIWLLSYPGGETRRITNDLNIYAALSVSGDASSLATVQTNLLSNVWVAPNADADRARQITTGSSRYYSLSWTPDGRILYASNSGGNLDVYISAADGSNLKQLTVNASSNFGPVASPDGRAVAFISNRAGKGYNIWRMDMDGGNLKRLTIGGMESGPQFTPDGRWVVYTSWEAGKPTIWKISIDGGEPSQLTDKYSMAPVVSPDGKQFACSYWDEQYDTRFNIAVIPLEGGAPVKTFDLPTMNVRWSSDGRALTYIDTRDNASNIWSQPLAGGPTRQLTNWKSDRIFNFAWSRDGKQLALSRGFVTNDVVLISDARLAENRR
jgi:Tol biopolymer transport system component